MTAAADNTRKTAMLPSVLSPWRPAGSMHAMPKATPQNLRRFAEMPMARRAINVVKDRISSMDWQVRPKRDAEVTVELTARMKALRHALEQQIRRTAFEPCWSRYWKTLSLAALARWRWRPQATRSSP